MVIKHNLECDTEDLCRCKENLKEPLHDCAMQDGVQCTCCTDCEGQCLDWINWSRDGNTKMCSCGNKSSPKWHNCLLDKTKSCNCCDDCQGDCAGKLPL